MTPANDNRPRTGATPLGTRLARAGRQDDLRRLVQYGRVPASVTWLSAEGGLAEAGAPKPDRITEIRPSPDELVRIAVRTAIAARTGIGPITRAELDAAAAKTVRRDKRGRISDWRGSDGKWRPAAELFRQPKGRRRKSEEERADDNARHLSLRGSGGFPEPIERSAVPSEGEDYHRLHAAHFLAANDNKNRAELTCRGLSGDYTFDKAWRNAGLPPACRVPRFMVGIARGVEFLGFRQHRSATASKGSFVGARDAAECQIIETIDQPKSDAALGEHAKILAMSIAGATAKEIASTMGWGGGRQGERKAVAAQDAALAALEKAAA